MNKAKRYRMLISLAVAGAVTVMSAFPVTAEEITTENEYVVEDELCGNASVYSGLNTSESANNYCGYIFVLDDGIYDKPSGGKKLNINGVSYDPDSCTLTLSNANIGCVYDDTLCHDKNGAIVFLGSRKNFELPDYKIELKGHNYLGGYSNFERKNGFWKGHFILSSNESGAEVDPRDPHNYFCVYSPLQSPNNDFTYSYDDCNLAYKNKGARSVTFEGDGDITINGPITVSVDTAKTVWYSGDDEGTNIVSINFADYIKDYKADGGERLCMNLNDYLESHTGYKACGYNSDGSGTNREIDDISRGNQFYKIGGEKPDTPEKPEMYIKSVKNLGEIGGHTVSVCYTDNIPYDGRKFIHGSYGYGYFEANKSTSRAVDIEVYVDGNRYYTYDSKILKDSDVSKELDKYCVTVKFKNNRDVQTVKGGKTVSPCFALSFRKQSRLDSGFIKAFKNYFKDENNWITFNIFPCDIKYAETTFLGVTGYHSKKLYDNSLDKQKYESKRKSLISKNLKLKGNIIKKIELVGTRLTDNEDSFYASKKLKWDKKFTEGKPKPKTDFHAELSGNYIVITGQGNYTGSVIVNNPLVADDTYYYQFNSPQSYRTKPGTVYDYRKPGKD